MSLGEMNLSEAGRSDPLQMCRDWVFSRPD